jgi:hypothetical protein
MALALVGCTLDVTGTAPGGERAHAHTGAGGGVATTTGGSAGGGVGGGVGGGGGATAQGGAGGAGARGGAGGHGGAGAGGAGAGGVGGGGGTGPCAGVSACSGETPVGWQHVARAESAASVCAAGLLASDVTEWVVAPGACGCDTPDIEQPNCQSGTVQVWHSGWSDGSCWNSGSSRNADGACHDPQYSFQFDWHYAAVGPGPVGGSCTAAGAVVAGALTSAPARLCAPEADACDGLLCAGGGLVECVIADGDLECPAGSPFSWRRLVSSGAPPALACPACSCTLSTSCAGTMTYFEDFGCSGQALAFPADGVCREAPWPSAYSYRYTAVASATPSVSPPAGAAPTVSGVRTLCCRP